MTTQETKSARQIKRGDIIKIAVDGGGEEVEEVVRDVSIVVHLANGRDVHVPVRDEVTVIHDDEVLSGELEGGG